MQYKITPPAKLITSLHLPASKSISNRALILNVLSLNDNPIENLSDCDDTKVLVDAFNSDSNVFDVQAAGSTMRFLTAFLAGMKGTWIIKGTPRMHERPIYPLVESLQAVGAEIEYLEKEGFPPLKIKGKRLKGGEIYLSGNISSQFISGLLMIAPTMEQGLLIHIENRIVSKPYINMTVRIMKQFGVKAVWQGNDIVIRPQQYKKIKFKVESDWSAASYWYEMVALIPDSEVELVGLSEDSVQGDSNIVTLFTYLGVSTEFTKDGVVIRNNLERTKKFFHTFVNEPDMVQTFVVTCCLLNIPFSISGVDVLKYKETDRVKALVTELRKLGYVLRCGYDDILEWDNETCPAEDNPVIETYIDHRMAMSFAPVSIVRGSIVINDPGVVHKSYPKFWDDIKSAGFEIAEV